MFLWFVGAGLVVVWFVFHDPAIDHRVLIAGTLLPDAVDAPFGGARFAHTVTASACLLLVVMLATRGHRHARRRWLALPIGTFIHLVADGAWNNAKSFWWPFLGGHLSGRLPSLDHGVVVAIVEEVIGAAAIVWFVRRVGLTDPAARATFFRTGRLPRHPVG